MDNRVLLVDPGDGPPDIAGRLRAAGATVLEADPARAVDLVGDADCSVVVHRPPSFDGVAVAGRLAGTADGSDADDGVDENPAAPVPVVFVADGDESLAARAVAAGVDRYVPVSGPDDPVAGTDAPGIDPAADDAVDADGATAAVRTVRAVAAVGDRGSTADPAPTARDVDPDSDRSGTGAHADPPSTATDASDEADGTGEADADAPSGVEGAVDAGADAAAGGRTDGGVSRRRDPPSPGDGVEVPDVPFELKERAMDEAPVGITISDPSLPDNPLIYVNDHFERMTGYGAAEALGTNCRFLQGEATDESEVARIRSALEANEPVSVELRNYRRDGEQFWNRLDIAPLESDGEVTHYVGFQRDVTQRKRAEAAAERYAEELDRERAALERIVDRVNGLVRDVTGTLVQATTRRGVERSICDLIADTDPYVGAWVGELDLGSEAVEVVAAADLPADLDGERLPLDAPGGEDSGTDAATDDAEAAGDGRDPVAAAVDRDEPVVAADFEGLHGRVAGAVDGAGPGCVVAIPLSYGDTSYGVLTVYAGDRLLDSERERTVLGVVGRMVATAINAVETKEILTAEDVVSLEFEVHDPDLFSVDIASTLGCRLEHVESVWRNDGSLLAFFDVEGADGQSVCSTAESHPRVEEAAVITDTDERCLVELVTDESSILTELADYSARLRGLSASGGTGHLHVEVPHDSTARSVASLVTDGYDEAELAAYREIERPPTTKQEFMDVLRTRLTDRQFTALNKAYVSGYYEWPRRTDGDALADSMGISRSTFHQHLRAAHRKVVSELFDQASPDR